MFTKLSGVKTSYVDSSIERMNYLNQFLTLCRVYWYILNIMSYAFNKLLPTTHFRQYAQRSRVRKLQYIAELERRVQALQTEGVEVSAEMDFLGQQNIMLDLENKALKQRLESLSQEHLIKRFQQEMFEREIGRLRSLFQQQQQQQHIPQQQGPTHSRSNSRDLDSQFANMSLKHGDPNSGRDAVPGLRI
jgi:regulator of replication initiation timing